LEEEAHWSEDPYAGWTPWLRRPLVRAVVATVAVGTFVLATLISSCGPRRRAPATTTTTVPLVEVMAPEW
jgi:hypothetical protein